MGQETASQRQGNRKQQGRFGSNKLTPDEAQTLERGRRQEENSGYFTSFLKTICSNRMPLLNIGSTRVSILVYPEFFQLNSP